MANCISSVMKAINYLYLISNLTFLLLGVLLIVAGKILKIFYNDFVMYLEAQDFQPDELLIVAGVVIFIIGMVGFIVLMEKSTMLTNLYAILLVILLIVEISCTVATNFFFAHKVESIEKQMYHNLEDYNNSTQASYRWGLIQTRLQCCGIDSPTTWQHRNITGFDITYHGDVFVVPEECCVVEKCLNQKIHERGCLDYLKTLVSDFTFFLGICMTTVAGIQLLLVVFSLLQAKSIRWLKTEKETTRHKLYEKLVNDLDEKNEMSEPIVYKSPTTHT